MVISDEQLKQLLVAKGILDEKTLSGIVAKSQTSEISLYDIILERDIVTDENLGLLIADFLKLPFVVLSKVSIPDEIFHIVPERIARKYKIISFAQDQSGLKVAMSDPQLAGVILPMITQKTGFKIVPYYATEKDISNAYRLYRRDIQHVFDQLINQSGSSVSATRIVNLVIKYAYQDKVSDIHIEPQEDYTSVRFRIDGVLRDVMQVPKSLHEEISTRIKVISRLRTDEHLAPQDGKMRVELDEEDLDIRVSIVPIVDGEKIVMRLLSSKARKFSLSDLGMTDVDLQKVNSSFNKSYGMIVSTGPTGSGKTTSIYSILKIINTREKNITTTEDPVEYRIKGVNQIQVNPKTDLTFANALRSILRQDPNVIFVGEIRDSETAGIAVNAALTGHLVLSTLHTNDAATALPRLTDMGVEPFLVASTVNVIIAQRLVRKICDMCRISYNVPKAQLTKNLSEDVIKKHFVKATVTLYKGKGCKVCHTTGYSGRVGLFEVLEVNKEIRKLITEKADSDVITREAIRGGMTTMLDDGIQKSLKGITSIEEVLRATKVQDV